MASRRSFLGGAGASIAYQVMGPKPTLEAAGPNEQVAMGFVGLGIRGSYLFESFRAVPGVRAVAAADLYDGHIRWAKALSGGALETTKDYQALLARKDIDAVAIATPEHWHARMVLDALAAGKHVYIEKPLAWSIAECLEIVEAQKRSGKLLMVGSQGKTAPITAKIREIIQSGVIGKVNMVRYATQRNSAEGAWVYPVPADASPQTIDWPRFLGNTPKLPFDARRFFRWRCWWEYSGGVSSDLWVHMLTALHEFMNVKGPRSVAAQGGIFRFNDGRTVPDLLSGLYEYDGFVVDMYVNLGNSRGSGSELVIMGTEGSLTVESGERLVVNFEPPENPVAWYGLNGWPADTREKYLASLGFGEGKEPVPAPVKPAREFPVGRGLEHYELFIQSLREGLPSRETAEDGLYAAGAAHLGNMAFRRGRRLLWDLATAKVTEA